jgi:hypothetical protein
MDCSFAQRNRYESTNEMMETLERMGENIIISAKLWKNGNFSSNDKKSLRGWVKTIERIENKMANKLGSIRGY